MAVFVSRIDVMDLLKRFGLNPPASDTRPMRHLPDERGFRVRIDGVVDENDEKIIRVQIDRTIVSRACPLTEWLANGLVHELRGHGAISGDEALIHALTHLVLRVSNLFENGGVCAVHLNPVFLTNRGYRIDGVTMERTEPLHLHRRLAPDAHDRKVQFDYRRSLGTPKR